MKIIRVGLVLTVLASSLAAPFAVSAADAPTDSKPLNLITSPLPINLASAPGKTVTTDLRVKQAGGDTQRLKVSLMKFAAYGDDGKPRLMDRGANDDYFDWVRFDKTSFDAPSNVWQTVKMTINVPKTAAFGYYYAVVFSRAGDDIKRGNNTNAINGGTAVLVLLDAQVKNAKRSLSLATFSTDHRLYEFIPSNFNIKFKNTGNVHIKPTGEIFIYNGDKQVASMPINAEQGNILPDSNRIYQSAWTDGFPHYETKLSDGKVVMGDDGQPEMKLTWSNGNGDKDLNPHFRFGRYTAKLFAVYDDGTRDVPIESEVSFWVIPWRFLLGALLLVGLIGFGIFAMVRGTLRGARRIGSGGGGRTARR